MNDWFDWNGVRCTEYGIHVTEMPPLTVPAERVSHTTVPGRPGSLTSLEGDDIFDDMLLSATCVLDDPARISAIAAWLKGSGTVTFANRQGGFYYARIANQIEFSKILRGNPHRSFAVTFRCSPFWYADTPAAITITASGSTFNNPGSVYADPIITVYGSGEITLMVNQTIIELSEITEGIVIDSALQEAYWGTASMNYCMNGDFPKLQPGMNAISWTGVVTNIQIQPNWRYL
jgi:phage-related protein